MNEPNRMEMKSETVKKIHFLYIQMVKLIQNFIHSLKILGFTVGIMITYLISYKKKNTSFFMIITVKNLLRFSNFYQKILV